ncbi:3cfc0419-771f-4b82-ab9a-b66dea8ec750 [Thermothielavioides terrestris]|uniref:3cfc0419-771f-4b82-ab9a-b66dea8ec750 n=1 Tax=Thermothielavioides terrestris TaxID=2587410 RepID=A0A446BYF9_9PEZI|nr:3cfc0419-771f-4b82-ab9a-b66dea8ec750 [Thermothielavioides terrestris]
MKSVMQKFVEERFGPPPPAETWWDSRPAMEGRRRAYSCMDPMQTVWDFEFRSLGPPSPEEEYWEAEDEEVQAEDYHDLEEPADLAQLPHNMWLSEPEKIRVNFKRAKAAAAKLGLDRSPYFPRTAGEYAGLKADMLEAKAARLRFRIQELERKKDIRQNAQWETIWVLGPAGQIQEKRVLIYSGLLDLSLPTAELDTTGINTSRCDSHFDPNAVGINKSEIWVQDSHIPGQLPTIYEGNVWTPPLYFPGPATHIAVGVDPAGIALFDTNHFSEYTGYTLYYVPEPALSSLQNENWGNIYDNLSDSYFTPSLHPVWLQDELSGSAADHGVDLHGWQELETNGVDNDEDSDSDASSTSSFTPSDYRFAPFRPLYRQPNGDITTARHPNKGKGKDKRKSKLTASSSAPTETEIPFPPALTPLEETLLARTTYRDGLSPVLARPNPFNATGTAQPECDWPTYAEYTADGDGRIRRRASDALLASTLLQDDPAATTTTTNNLVALPDPAPAIAPPTRRGAALPLPPAKITRRFLPIPRLRDVVDPRLPRDTATTTTTIPGVGGPIPWEHRAPAGERWDLHSGRRLREAWRRSSRRSSRASCSGFGCGCGSGNGNGRVWAGQEGGGEDEEEEEVGWDTLEDEVEAQGLGWLIPGVRMAWALVGHDEGVAARGRVREGVREMVAQVDEVMRAYAGPY